MTLTEGFGDDWLGTSYAAFGQTLDISIRLAFIPSSTFCPPSWMAYCDTQPDQKSYNSSFK